MSAEEVGPRAAGALGRGVDPGLVGDLPDGGRGYRDPEYEQFAVVERLFCPPPQLKRLSRRSVDVTRKNSQNSPVTATEEPATLTGQALRASVLRWKDERQRLLAEVRRHGSIDVNELIRVVFEVTVRRLFQPGADLREISEIVARMRDGYGESVPILETEALIRKALGEDIPVSDIDLRTELLAKNLTFMAFADLKGRNEIEVNAVIVEAEALAHARGLRPTLA